jgi:Gram-negative bacterial TonB protein C-terminal
MKKFVFIALICLCFGLNVFAQAKIKVLKYEVPKYSPAAAAVGIKGEFIVVVKINKDGKVISTNVEKVHPLLKRVVEESASKWLFSNGKNSEERQINIIFEYLIKVNNSKKNTDKPSDEKAKFKKPFRLIITRTNYPRASVY